MNKGFNKGNKMLTRSPKTIWLPKVWSFAKYIGWLVGIWTVVLLGSTLLGLAAGYGIDSDGLQVQIVPHGIAAMVLVLTIPVGIIYGLLRKMKCPVIICILFGIFLLCAVLGAAIYAPVYFTAREVLLIFLGYMIFSLLLPDWVLTNSRGNITLCLLLAFIGAGVVAMFQGETYVQLAEILRSPNPIADFVTNYSTQIMALGLEEEWAIPVTGFVIAGVVILGWDLIESGMELGQKMFMEMCVSDKKKRDTFPHRIWSGVLVLSITAGAMYLGRLDRQFLVIVCVIAGLLIIVMLGINGVRQMKRKQEIIFATSNEGKIREIKEILRDTNITVHSLKDVGIDVDIVEDGVTFEDNAIIKARTISEMTGKLALADDSGLEIDYLHGEPGVHSARYMGEDTSYDVKNAALLKELDGVPKEDRTARFVCVIAAVSPEGKVQITRGTMEGYIGYESQGENGFGYDPIFYLDEFGCSSAELTMEQKNQVSHRGKALRQMKEKLV